MEILMRSLIAAALVMTPAWSLADETGTVQLPVRIDAPTTLRATFSSPASAAVGQSMASGDCPQQESTHTDATWEPGAYIVQAGFEDEEILAASYILPADAFPVRFDVAEVLFATANAVETTTTHWSFLLWEGTPTNGTLLAEFNSDGTILPHLVMPPGTTGTIIQVMVDPGDPEQIYIDNDGSRTFTIGFRIDQHNSPGVPCITAPPSNRNAFPVTDTSGVASQTGNWIKAVSGTACVCGDGWFTFQQFPSFCTPSGDWVLRARWTPVDCGGGATGACCLSGGACLDGLSENDCVVLDGAYQGDDSSCDEGCPAASGACCIKATGGCVDFTQEDCVTVGGVWQGEGTTCDAIECFPEGACCLPSGACVGPVDPDDCAVVGGVFQGDGTSCASADCPEPMGACCDPGGEWCLDVPASTCDAIGGQWKGAETDCEIPDVCEEPPPACPEDITGDGTVGVNDLLAVLDAWGTDDEAADINDDGVVNVTDLLSIIDAWGACP
jgi:hypothetical protein